MEETQQEIENTHLGRRESSSLFLFKKEGEIEEMQEIVEAREAERAANQKLADDMADEERERRITEAKDREDEFAIVRQINIEYTISAADAEQERRVREYEIAKVHEQMLREQNKKQAIEAAEAERNRRLQELEAIESLTLEERAEQQQLAVQTMEQERTRRLSSIDHAERMLERKTVIRIAGSDEELRPHDATDDFSDITVAHSSAAKIMVDELNEWRCLISSESPDEEKDKLRALRQSLEEDLIQYGKNYPELVGDMRLLRFLRGHKMNVSIAATKYREMLEFRRKFQMDLIRDAIAETNMPLEEIPNFQKIITHIPFLYAYDLTDVVHGHVLDFEMSGYADFRALMTDLTDDDWQLFFLYAMESRAMKLDQLSRQTEKLVQTIVVHDLTGFSISRFNPRLLQRLQSTISIATKCYPETVHETIILHTPWVFHKVWNAIITTTKLQETQLNKIRMGSDAFTHLLTLLGGRDRLPKLLGGKNTVHAIPQTGYLGRDSYLLLCEDGATQADIRAGGTLQLPFRMSVNDTICWEYEVKAHDIDFSVKFRTQGVGGAEEAEKIPKARVGKGQTVANSFTAIEEGTVVLSWDNSFSWARGKTVAYKAKVVKSTHDFSCLDISGNDCV